MSSIVGKMMNSCENDETLNRVSKQRQYNVATNFSYVFSFIIDETFLTATST